MTDLEPIDICRLQLANLKTRLEAEIKRRREAEEVIRHYADEKNWECVHEEMCSHDPKSACPLFAFTGRDRNGYDKAREYLNKHAEGK
jgi:hypothetical protein